MKDPVRLDRPSASGFGIVSVCLGQPNLKRQLPDNVVELPDDLTDSGTKIHKARETGDFSELDEVELPLYEAGLRYEKKLFERWAQENEIVNWTEGVRENRLWLHDPQTGEPALSGQLDVHFIGTNAAGEMFILVVDWKTGFAWSLTPSQRNWQLRVQAVLAWREYNDVKNVWVAFVKPRATSDRIDFTPYQLEDLKRSEEAVHQILWRSKQEDAPRVPGTHCDWCPCKSFCKEAAAYAMLPSVFNPDTPVLSEGDIPAMIEQLSPKDLALLYRRSRVIGKILEADKARLKTFNQDQLREIGLRREANSPRSKITKTGEAYNALRTFGISSEELWTALKFTKGELTDALRRDQGWGKAQTEGFIKGQLAQFMETSEVEDSIVSL